MTDTWKVEQGDCRDIMRTLPDNSVDAIVSDPPYGLSFMGKAWDHGVPGVEFWTEALRVAKPGAHLVAFGGTRTYHRLAVAIEDAGWEVRDCLSWLYGSGFPKSLAVDKAIDKVNGRDFADRYALGRHIRERREACGFTRAQVNEWFGYADGCEHWERQDPHGARVPTVTDWRILQERLGLLDDWREMVERIAAEREVVGVKKNVMSGWDMDGGTKFVDRNITAPATDAAKRWHGWGTALKPAWEPIILARKPLTGTVAANVTRYGTGAINVDGCRIEARGRPHIVSKSEPSQNAFGDGLNGSRSAGTFDLGRWPANVLLDEDAAGLLGESSRFFYTAKVSRKEREAGLDGMPERISAKSNGAQAADDRGEMYDPNTVGLNRTVRTTNHHPTVKPIALMRWLCRLVTPPNGLILDPFNGSGSTGCAAVLEDFRYLGCELEAEYVEIARRRIAYWEGQRAEPDLFDA